MDLYALPPEEFTAARDKAIKQARRDKDPDAVRARKALRRPSVAAYAVNRLVRDEPALLTQLLDLGAALAQAQTGGDADALRQLGTQRRALVEAVADRAGQLVDGLGPGPRSEVVATLEAAMADPASAEAVRTGRLVRALSYAGFGGVDLDDAVAPRPADESSAPERENADDPSSGVERPGAARGEAADGRKAGREQAAREDAAGRRQAARSKAIKEAEATLHHACGELDDAVGRQGRAEREADTAQRDRKEAEGDLDRTREDLAEVERALTEARSVVRGAEQRTDRARQQSRDADGRVDLTGREVTQAQQATERAQRELDVLRRRP